MEDTSRVAAVALGVVTLLFEGGKNLVLSDCLYVPDVRRNLVSVSCLSYNEYSSVFNKDSIFVKYNDDIEGIGAQRKVAWRAGSVKDRSWVLKILIAPTP